jgi:hypothetical protein
MANKGVK